MPCFLDDIYVSISFMLGKCIYAKQALLTGNVFSRKTLKGHLENNGGFSI